MKDIALKAVLSIGYLLFGAVLIAIPAALVTINQEAIFDFFLG